MAPDHKAADGKEHGNQPDGSMATADMMQVQLCLAWPQEVCLLDLAVRRDATIGEVIEQSGIALRYPGFDLSQCRLGVFGKLKTGDARLYPGDRIELYRPLQADPMDARRRRAKKHANKPSNPRPA